jgi:DNA-directed RNA polymerase subunit H (RpoH/RPB5)
MEPLSDRNLLQMKHETLKILKDRGYVIPSEEASILNKTIKDVEFKNMYLEARNNMSHPLFSYINRKISSLRPSMSNIYFKDGKSCLVYFAEPEGKNDKKISNEQLSDFCRILIEKKVNDAILISNVPSSSATESLCTDVVRSSNGVFIQYFMDDELLFNPLDHALTPHHRILTDKEVKELREVDKISLEKLPRISALDPICKRLGAKPGNDSKLPDVIEITRKIIAKKCIIDEEISYRMVFMPRTEKSRK